MVASLKAGYKPLYLQRLLAIFDEPGWFKSVVAHHTKPRRGLRGVHHGNKLHIFNCMGISKKI